MLTIPPRATEGYAPDDAVSQTFILAARATLDHGCRYFTIVGGPIRLGTPVTIRLYENGEVDPARAYDARDIVMRGPPSAQSLAR